MVMYRRNRVAGGTYFFTVALRDRSSSILIDRFDDLRRALASVKLERPFDIAAMVILPERFHAIWVLPTLYDNYPSRMRLFNSRFTRLIVKAGLAVRRNANGECDLWQRRYLEHTIRDDADFQKHVDSIHWNPVKHGYVDRVIDWTHSTFHLFVAEDVYSSDWGGRETQDSFGDDSLRITLHRQAQVKFKY